MNTMNNYLNDSDKATIQRMAHQAFEEELIAQDQFMDGVISEDEYTNFMDATQMAIEYAISCGVSRRDLPPAW